MIEYQGWVVIRESFDEKNESEELFNKIKADLGTKIKDINSERLSEVCTLRMMNCNLSLLIASLDNHKSESWDDIVNLFYWLSERAVGSYGLLYFHDDEDTSGLDNVFQVLVLKKGSVSFEVDSFLSPYSPEVEE